MPERPIVFLPGYYGTKFRHKVSKDTVWIDLKNIFRPSRVMELMQLEPDQVEAYEVLNEVDILPFFEFKVYKSLKTFLRRRVGYANDAIHMHPIDWRQSLDLIADHLHQYIQENIDDQQQVDILGHSHGGLVGRAYMAKYGGDRVARFITLGTPHRGMLKVLEALSKGITLWSFSENQTKKWSRDLPSPYELLPRFNDGLFSWNGQSTDPLSSQQWVNRHAGNPAVRQKMIDRLNQAQTVTDQLLPNQVPVPSWFIFGTRLETMSHAHGGAGQDIQIDKDDIGDGVVPTLSADGRGMTGEITRCPAIQASHMLMFKDARVKTLMKSILIDNRLPDDDAQVLLAWEGNKNFFTPGQPKRLTIEVRDLRGDPIPNVSVKLSLKARSWNKELDIPLTNLDDHTLIPPLPRVNFLRWRVEIRGQGVPPSKQTYRGTLRSRVRIL